MGALLSLLILLPGQAAPPPVVDPETEARAAISFLEKISNDDRLFVRFASNYAVPKEEMAEWERWTKIWWRQNTLDSNRRNFPNRVPGSDTLFWFDLRLFKWNGASWRAVALRDKAFREPGVIPPTAQRLRKLVGENQPENFHVIAVVDAFGLFRRTYQTNETSDHYDLIFSEQRFPEIKGEVEKREVLRYFKGGVDPADGKEYPPGWYEYLVPFPKRGFVDFPKNYDEWLTAFLPGLKVEDYENTVKKLKTRRGAVIKGMEDSSGAAKSFVARNNREAWMEQFIGGLGTIFGQTYDVKKTAGKRDLEENAFTDQDRDRGRQFRDGGELLITLPAGDGLDSLVINAKEERIEAVPGDIAIHTRDPRDRIVRNGPMVCLNCHADAYGWIPMANVIEKTSPDEVDVRFQKKLKDGSIFRDVRAASDYDAFFLGWQDSIKPAREVMKGNWAQATGTERNKFKDGFTGQKIGELSLKWKWKYDDPVKMDQMVRETGAPKQFLRLAASRSVLRRAVDAVRMEEVPRASWDEDVFPEIMKLLNSRKEKLTP